MTQIIQTPEQKMYLARLMGYDYCIQYRSSNTNLVVDALSRLKEGSEGTMLLLPVPCLTFLDELKKQLKQEPAFIEFQEEYFRPTHSLPGIFCYLWIDFAGESYLVTRRYSLHSDSVNGVSFYSDRGSHGGHEDISEAHREFLLAWYKKRCETIRCSLCGLSTHQV